MKTKFVPKILLFRGKGFFSKLIRWQTRSRYSHAAILLDDGHIIESWTKGGVQISHLRDWSNIDAYSVDGMTSQQWDVAIQFAKSQIGKKYDYRSVFRFLSKRKAPDNQKWFCSEFVYTALAVAGVELLRNIDPSEISPAILSYSPKLRPSFNNPL